MKTNALTAALRAADLLGDDRWRPAQMGVLWYLGAGGPMLWARLRSAGGRHE